MFDTLEERVERRKTRHYAIQFTNGTRDEYDAIISEAYDEPHIEVDCADLTDYDCFFEAIADDLVTDMSESFKRTRAVKKHFRQESGSLILHNFHELNKETTSDLAEYIKGLWETLNYSGDKHITIAITTDDAEAIFIGDSDLSGRVHTIDVQKEGKNEAN